MFSLRNVGGQDSRDDGPVDREIVGTFVASHRIMPHCSLDVAARKVPQRILDEPFFVSIAMRIIVLGRL